ncbi:MAG: PrsW family intramembrane metalloprotease [Chloroflexales bacterium]|nr:PrsW family intramembrane metalloprotease [Chloroflexales bacterium]
MSNDRDIKCCVCHQPLSAPYKTLGGRAYCDRHYAMVNKPHTGFWRATVIQIIGMAALSALVAFLADTVLGPLTGTGLLVAGVLLALIPSALWLSFFYQQDRLEPEPKHQIAAVFILAALLADVFLRRITSEWFRVSEWASADTLTSLLASILIIAATSQLIIYLAVRLIVYDTDEFDERMDGIIYGTVAGLGVATVSNLYFVLANDGVALGPGVVQTVTTALAEASFGGLLGWFMAEAKFEHKPAWWVPAGFGLATLANGLFSWLIGEVGAAGLRVDPWRSLALGIAVALGAFLLLALLMRRTTEVTLRRFP